MFSWIVWFYKAKALFHIQFEIADVTEDIEGMCELCKISATGDIVKLFEALLTSIW